MKIYLCSFVLVVSLAQCGAAFAQSSLSFDHTTTSKSRPLSVSLALGEKFDVEIKNTLESKFEYSIRGFEIDELQDKEQHGLAGAAPVGGLEANQVVTLSQVHNDLYGGYLIDVVSKDNSVVDATLNGKKVKLPKFTTFTILVKPKKWSVDYSGAFTVSKLVNRRFAAELNDEQSQPPTESTENMANMATYSVVANTDAEDSASFGLAAMANLYHTSRPNWALSFGIGTDNNDTSYFLGGSYRFGETGALTLGYNWAKVDTLPAGVSLGDEISDPNLLNSLGEKTEGDFFIAISYTFSGAKNQIFGGFAPSTNTGVGTTSKTVKTAN